MWELYPEIWPTESAYMSWIRGGIRRYLWSKNPVKLEFIKQNRIKIPNPNPKGKVKEVWGGVCALTGEIHPIANLECDHKAGNHSLKTLDDLQTFFEAIVMVTLDDLQLVSKEAHKIKSYAEKHNIPFDTARAEKEAKQLVDKKLDIAFIKEHNIKPESTQLKRREQIVNIKLGLLSKEEEDE